MASPERTESSGAEPVLQTIDEAVIEWHRFLMEEKIPKEGGVWQFQRDLDVRVHAIGAAYLRSLDRLPGVSDGS